MRYMLDTNILIYLLKNRPESVAKRINKLGEDAQLSNVNYFVRLASIMMAAFSVSWFHCFVASVDNYLLPV